MSEITKDFIQGCLGEVKVRKRAYYPVLLNNNVMKTRMKIRVGAYLVWGILLCFTTSAQERSEVRGDTVYYAGAKFYPGRVITFGYGSGTNKEFVFVKAGMMYSASSTSFMSKQQATIVSLQMKGSKAFAKAMLGKLKVTIDLEGAVDNRELIL